VFYPPPLPLYISDRVRIQLPELLTWETERQIPRVRKGPESCTHQLPYHPAVFDMKAYWFNEESYAQDPNQKLPHIYSPERLVSSEELRDTGLRYWSVPVQNWESEIGKIATENNYKNRDFVNITKEALGDRYEPMLKSFFEEHLHEDEEIRYILSGSGFFDIRDRKSDAWIRLHVFPGDLIVLPAGIYHRFTLDESNNIKALRLFQDEPKWIPYARSKDTDANPYRIKYVQDVHEANRRVASL